MNIIINQEDLSKGLSMSGSYTKNQLALFSTTWTKENGFSPPLIGCRCRAEVMQRFIDIREKKKI